MTTAPVITNLGVAGSAANLINGKIFGGDLYYETVSKELRKPLKGYLVIKYSIVHLSALHFFFSSQNPIFYLFFILLIHRLTDQLIGLLIYCHSMSWSFCFILFYCSFLSSFLSLFLSSTSYLIFLTLTPSPSPFSFLYRCLVPL